MENRGMDLNRWSNVPMIESEIHGCVPQFIPHNSTYIIYGEEVSSSNIRHVTHTHSPFRIIIMKSHNYKILLRSPVVVVVVVGLSLIVLTMIKHTRPIVINKIEKICVHARWNGVDFLTEYFSEFSFFLSLSSFLMLSRHIFVWMISICIHSLGRAKNCVQRIYLVPE